MPNTQRDTDPIEVIACYCIHNDDAARAPSRRRWPVVLPKNAPLPRRGEFVYLTSSSAWRVDKLIHEWHGPHRLHIEVWLEYEGTGRHQRPSGFDLTQ